MIEDRRLLGPSLVGRSLYLMTEADSVAEALFDPVRCWEHKTVCGVHVCVLNQFILVMRHLTKCLEYVWSYDDDDGVTGCPGKNKDSSRLANCADRNCPAVIFPIQHKLLDMKYDLSR